MLYTTTFPHIEPMKLKRLGRKIGRLFLKRGHCVANLFHFSKLTEKKVRAVFEVTSFVINECRFIEGPDR